MYFREVETSALSAPEAVRIDARISSFLAVWNESSLTTTEIGPDGKGSTADIEAIDYIIYESCYSLVASSTTDFLSLCSAVFGRCLTTLLHFDWCYVHLPSGAVVGVKHSYNGLVVPLDAIIAKHLSGEPQYENFSRLLLDVYMSTHTWPIGHHFLNESSWILEDGEFEAHWGFSVPEDISRRFLLLRAMSEEEAIRGIGLQAYSWRGTPDWESLRRSLDHLESVFNGYYGEAWREHLKTSCPGLFV